MSASDSDSEPVKPGMEAPEGYVRINDTFSEIWTKNGFDGFCDMTKEADECCPDVQDCYIYSNFFGYALLSIVEKKLDNWFKAFKKAPLEIDTIVLLEQLTLFLINGDEFLMSDDGDRVKLFCESFGAAWYSQIIAIEDAGKLNNNDFPSIANAARTADNVLANFNTMSFDIEKGTAIRAALARNKLDYAVKKNPLLGMKSGEDDEEDEEEDEDEDMDEADPVADYLENSRKEVEKDLGIKNDFKALWKEYKSSFYGIPEPKFGKGYNITKWPKYLRDKVAF